MVLRPNIVKGVIRAISNAFDVSTRTNLIVSGWPPSFFIGLELYDI